MNREFVATFVLRVPGMPLNLLELNGVRRGQFVELLPKVEVFHLRPTALFAPPPTVPPALVTPNAELAPPAPAALFR